MVRLSGFGDEIATPLKKQLQFMDALGIHAIEVRGVDGTNVSNLTDAQAHAARAMLDAHGFAVSALGSPIGKCDIHDAFNATLDAFKRTVEIAHVLGAPAIRLFSFYVPRETADHYADEILHRLTCLKDVAADANVLLLHENESDIYGESPEHCLRLARELCDAHFALTFDPSNFVQRSWDPLLAWELLKPYVRYIHIKDSVHLLAGTDVHQENPHRVAGTGEACVRTILADLKASGYDGYLSIEPHLTTSTFVSGTRAGKWAAAALALQTLLDEIDYAWQEE